MNGGDFSAGYAHMMGPRILIGLVVIVAIIVAASVLLYRCGAASTKQPQADATPTKEGAD